MEASNLRFFPGPIPVLAARAAIRSLAPGDGGAVPAESSSPRKPLHALTSKLYAMLEDKDNWHAIRWHATGDGFTGAPVSLRKLLPHVIQS